MSPDVTDFDKTFKPKTQLAENLWAIRQRAIANGLKLKDAETIRRELEEQRGFIDD